MLYLWKYNESQKKNRKRNKEYRYISIDKA